MRYQNRHIQAAEIASKIDVKILTTQAQTVYRAQGLKLFQGSRDMVTFDGPDKKAEFFPSTGNQLANYTVEFNNRCF